MPHCSSPYRASANTCTLSDPSQATKEASRSPAAPHIPAPCSYTSRCPRPRAPPGADSSARKAGGGLRGCYHMSLRLGGLKAMGGAAVAGQGRFSCRAASARASQVGTLDRPAWDRGPRPELSSPAWLMARAESILGRALRREGSAMLCREGGQAAPSVKCSLQTAGCVRTPFTDALRSRAAGQAAPPECILQAVQQGRSCEASHACSAMTRPASCISWTSQACSPAAKLGHDSIWSTTHAGARPALFADGHVRFKAGQSGARHACKLEGARVGTDSHSTLLEGLLKQLPADGDQWDVAGHACETASRGPSPWAAAAAAAAAAGPRERCAARPHHRSRQRQRARSTRSPRGPGWTCRADRPCCAGHTRGAKAPWALVSPKATLPAPASLLSAKVGLGAGTQVVRCQARLRRLGQGQDGQPHWAAVLLVSESKVEAAAVRQVQQQWQGQGA